jgi:hypothetical protein
MANVVIRKLGENAKMAKAGGEKHRRRGGGGEITWRAAAG